MTHAQNHLSQRMRRVPVASGRMGGFTLAETMISVLCWSAVIGTVISVFMAQHKSFYVGNAYIDLNKEARTAMDWMAGDIRWATNVLPSHGSYSKSNSCVILEIPSIDPVTGDIINVATTFDHIIYTQSGSALHRVIDPNGGSKRTAETRTVAHDVGSLLFSSGGTGLGSIGDPGTVKILDITLMTSKTILSQTLTNTLSTTIKLRNKE